MTVYLWKLFEQTGDTFVKETNKMYSQVEGVRSIAPKGSFAGVLPKDEIVVVGHGCPTNSLIYPTLAANDGPSLEDGKKRDIPTMTLRGCFEWESWAKHTRFLKS